MVSYWGAAHVPNPELTFCKLAMLRTQLKKYIFRSEEFSNIRSGLWQNKYIIVMLMASLCAFHQDLQEMKRWKDNEGRKYLESVPVFRSIWACAKNQAPLKLNEYGIR